jgi:uncharacterized RDD family membrane protein YckC
MTRHEPGHRRFSFLTRVRAGAHRAERHRHRRTAGARRSRSPHHRVHIRLDDPRLPRHRLLLLVTWAITEISGWNVSRDSETLWILTGAVPASAIYFLYHPVLEALMDGRTPGKRMTGLRVLTTEGQAPTTGSVLTRNVFRIIDSLPGFYVVGLFLVMFGSRHQRFGDLAAGTVVALERAPFLEKLARLRGAGSDTWQQVRQRAMTLGLRRGEVSEALAVVDDYRRAARELGAARPQGTAAADRDRAPRSHLRGPARCRASRCAPRPDGVVVGAPRPRCRRRCTPCGCTCSQ